MNIGIISDTHGSVTAWREAYQKYLQKTDLIIHCGDVLYHGPRNPLPEGHDPKSLAVELNSLTKPWSLFKEIVMQRSIRWCWNTPWNRLMPISMPRN